MNCSSDGSYIFSFSFFLCESEIIASVREGGTSLFSNVFSAPVVSLSLIHADIQKKKKYLMIKYPSARASNH